MEHFSTHFIMIDNVVEPKHIMVVVPELDTSGFNLTDTILEKIQISYRHTVLREVLRRPFDGAVASRYTSRRQFTIRSKVDDVGTGAANFPAISS